MTLKKTYQLAAFLFIAASFFSACADDKKKLPDMYPLYMFKDKRPMGTNIAYRLLPSQFNAKASLTSKRINGIVDELSYVKASTYISIGKNPALDDGDIGALLGYAMNGNDVFIADDNINAKLLDTLGIKTRNELTADINDSTWLQRDTWLRIADTGTYGKKQHGFFYYPFRTAFTGYDSSTTKVLGVNENGRPDYIVTRYGKGKIYLHAEPSAFTNYFLLTADNIEYYKQVFSYLNKNSRVLYWADTERFGNKTNDFSALSVFWKDKQLMYALLLFCSLILLYIAFGSKRKRRLVPETPPNNNDSLSFVQTIGNLYLQKKDNRNIAVKMMTYFLEHIRSSYHLGTNNINADFVQSLSRKSGVEEKKVQELMEKAAYINDAETITEQELFDINNLIYEFYKR